MRQGGGSPRPYAYVESKVAPAVVHQSALAELQSCAVRSRYRRGQEIDGGHSATEYWRSVITGAARQCAIRMGGRRQIIDLLLPGDWFGFPATNLDHISTEAIA